MTAAGSSLRLSNFIFCSQYFECQLDQNWGREMTDRVDISYKVTKIPSLHLHQFSWFWVFLSWIEERNSTGLHYRLLPGQSGGILPSGRNLGTVTTKPIGMAGGGEGEGRFSQTIISVWIQYPAISSHTQILCSLILRPIHPQLNICCIYLLCWEATLSPLSSPGERGLMDAFNLGDVKIVSHIIRLFTDHLQRVLFRF